MIIWNEGELPEHRFILVWNTKLKFAMIAKRKGNKLSGSGRRIKMSDCTCWSELNSPRKNENNVDQK